MQMPDSMHSQHGSGHQLKKFLGQAMYCAQSILSSLASSR